MKKGAYEPDSYPNPGRCSSWISGHERWSRVVTALSLFWGQLEAKAFQEEYDFDSFSDLSAPRYDPIHNVRFIAGVQSLFEFYWSCAACGRTDEEMEGSFKRGRVGGPCHCNGRYQTESCKYNSRRYDCTFYNSIDAGYTRCRSWDSKQMGRRNSFQGMSDVLRAFNRSQCTFCS
jgi:hypothetical protein